MTWNSGLNFGAFIDAVKALPDETIIRFDFGYFTPKGKHSYRGYYEDIALGYTDETHDRLTAKDLAAELTSYLGQTISGYKGGDYTVTRDTGMWVSADSSECTGTIITSVRDLGYGYAIINTAYED